MSSAYNIIGNLTKSQREALTHVIKCRGNDNTNHIAEQIGLAQSSVYEALQELVKNGYMRTQSGKGTEKLYRATSKGWAAAFLLGSLYDDVYEYCKMFDSTGVQNFDILRRIVKDAAKRDYLMKLTFEYMFANKYFDKELTPAEIKKIQMFIASEGMLRYGTASTVKDIANKYSLDTTFLKDTVRLYKERILKAEKELEDL